MKPHGWAPPLLHFSSGSAGADFVDASGSGMCIDGLGALELDQALSAVLEDWSDLRQYRSRRAFEVDLSLLTWVSRIRVVYEQMLHGGA